MRRLSALAFAILVGIFLAGAAFAEDEPPAASEDTAELAKKLQNPIAALISVPFQSNFEWGAGQGSKGFRYLVNVQPVIPISISENWNVISRTIVPIIHQTDTIGPTTQDGLGDIVQSLFFSPKAPGRGGIIWGAGPVLQFPSATDDFLGAGKFGLGRSAGGCADPERDSRFHYGDDASHAQEVRDVQPGRGGRSRERRAPIPAPADRRPGSGSATRCSRRRPSCAHASGSRFRASAPAPCR